MLFVAKLVAIVLAATVSGAIAVPIGVFSGVHPILVFGVAAVTAVAVVWVLVLFGHRVRSGVIERFGGGEAGVARAGGIVDQFGPAGLGLVGPVFPGVIVSSLTGVALGVEGRRLALWLSIGILFWFGIFTIAWWGIRAGFFQ